MIVRIRTALAGDGLRSRALRGTMASLSVTGSSMVLRFVSNIVLTRLLFPEAFGLMALVQVVILGLSLLSTFGLRISVMQHPRGDDPDFLNTAWTIQIIRGVLLWIVVCILAGPAAVFYNQPMLEQVLPVAGLGLIVEGFYTTNAMSVQRNLQLGRYSALTLLSQVINLIILSFMAWLFHSVWALIFGLVVGPITTLILYGRYLPGIRNRFQLDKGVMREILKLGKYLFFSTIATYVISQSDRAFLGKAIPIELLGVYGISFVLATLPSVLASRVAGSVVFPLYRMRHPAESAQNRVKIFRIRRLVAGCALMLNAVMAFASPWLIDVLYDARYVAAGPITTILCLSNVPLIVLNGVMNAALAKGDSLRFMLANVATAGCQLALLYFTVGQLGVLGAALAIGGAPLLTYPLLVVFLRRYRNWDVLGDTALMATGLLVTGGACWLHWTEILHLIP